MKDRWLYLMGFDDGDVGMEVRDRRAGLVEYGLADSGHDCYWFDGDGCGTIPTELTSKESYLLLGIRLAFGEYVEFHATSLEGN